MSDKVFTLPIVIEDVECVTECWTHNRMAVLKTSPYYEDWIASRYNIYTTSQFNFRFGETWMYTPDYYDPILESKPVHLFGMTASNVVKKLKIELENGYHLIMTIKPYRDKEIFREVDFYGYNDHEEVFYGIKIEKGVFQKQTYSYAYIAEMLPELQNNFLKREQRGMELSIQYEYPIYVFKLWDEYSTENCAFYAYKKISDELNGAILHKHMRNTTGGYEMTTKVYRGIACLDGLVDMIHKILAGEEMEPGCQGIVVAVQKLYEHRRMMIVSMRYVLRKWEKAMKPETVECIKRYEECCEIVQKWVNMAIKYRLTQSEELLRKIEEEVPGVYEREHDVLDQFVNSCLDWDTFNKLYI